MGNTLNRIHGLQFWLVFFRSILPLKGQNAAAAQLLVLGVDDAKRIGVEARRPFSLCGFLDRHRFPHERFRDVNQIAVPLDLAAMSDPSDGRMVWIIRLWRCGRHDPWAGAIMLFGRRLAERLMR